MKTEDVCHLTRHEMEGVVAVLEHAVHVREALNRAGFEDDRFPDFQGSSHIRWERALTICRDALGLDETVPTSRTG